VLSQSDCISKYSKDQISEYMLCAAAPGADACYGDSGGPFVMQVPYTVHLMIKNSFVDYYEFCYGVSIWCYLASSDDQIQSIEN
jgi:Trypsin